MSRGSVWEYEQPAGSWLILTITFVIFLCGRLETTVASILFTPSSPHLRPGSRLNRAFQADRQTPANVTSEQTEIIDRLR